MDAQVSKYISMAQGVHCVLASIDRSGLQMRLTYSSYTPFVYTPVATCAWQCGWVYCMWKGSVAGNIAPAVHVYALLHTLWCILNTTRIPARGSPRNSILPHSGCTLESNIKIWRYTCTCALLYYPLSEALHIVISRYRLLMVYEFGEGALAEIECLCECMCVCDRGGEREFKDNQWGYPDR